MVRTRRISQSVGRRLPSRGVLQGVAAGTAALGAPASALAAREWNLQPPVTPIAQQMFDLHIFIFWVCVVIFVGVFGVMFYSIFKHRKSVGHKAAQFHENTTVEIVWTVIPILILLFMAFPATKTILAMKDTSAPDLTVKVTGYQWKWGYDYLQEGFGFYSNLKTPLAQIENREPKGANYLLEVDQPMVVPVGAKVRLLITADDVIHSWWVPAFGVKQDAIPGFVRDSWFTANREGTFRGQCAELCGKEHGFMPIVVEVMSKDDYATWVADAEAEGAAAADDPGEVWTGPRWSPRRQGLRRQLRGLPPGHRQGRPGRLPGARRLEARHRPQDRPAEAGAQRQAGDGDGRVQAVVGHRPRGGGHLHAQQLGQQDRRGDPAGRDQGGAQVAAAQVRRPSRGPAKNGFEPGTRSAPSNQ